MPLRVAYSAAVLVALVACQRAPARIYTDAEIAKLEAQVMAKVAETDASCSKPELLEFANGLDEKCVDAVLHLSRGASADSNEVAAIDELCGANVLAALGRAAVGTPSCSPYQVGQHADPVMVRGKPGQEMAPMWSANILSLHALRELDAYVGMTELLLGIRVFQDLARGRIDLLQWMLATAMENKMVATGEKLLSRASLPNEQLDDLAAALDTAIAAEPGAADALQGEVLSTALHYGVAGLKPKDWQPPGGRSDSTSSSDKHLTTEHHDWRDDHAQLIAGELRLAEKYALACPPSATLATCSAILPASEDLPDMDVTATDKQATRLAMFPDEETRHDSQQQLMQDLTKREWFGVYVRERGQMLTRLIALRLHVQVVRDGRCPNEAQIAQALYSALRTAAVLGDSVQVTRTEDALVVDAPTWTNTTRPGYPPAGPISIPCP